MTEAQKKKFRFSNPWRTFRLVIKKERLFKDYVTGEKLLKTWQLHHLNLDDRQYTNLTKHAHFMPLNKDTHKVIHWLYRYYKRDRYFLVRIKEVLDYMLTITEESKHAK